MKKILVSMFLIVIGLCLVGCANTGIEYKVSYDNMASFGQKKVDGGLQIFSDAYITSQEELISLCDEWNNKSFDENDELVLKREYTIAGYGEVKDCYINEEIGTNVETPQKEENIYYNSQEKRLYVDVENAEMIMVYDAVGKNIMTKEVSTSQTLRQKDL